MTDATRPTMLVAGSGKYLPALGVFVFALAYLLVLRPYGFQLEDEGTLLFQFRRVLLGQQPYVDFHTGYTPGLFAFGKAALLVGGGSVTAVRLVLVLMNALTAAGLCELTRRVAAAWIAPIPALLWLAFVPVYVGEFAAFNIPYPTWPVTLGWVVVGLLLSAWVDRPRWSRLVLTGLTAAAILWIRPNSGAFALAGATWIVCAISPRRRVIDTVAAAGAAAFMALGVWYTFQFRVLGIDAFVHLLPTFVLVALVVGPLARRFENAAAPASFPSLAVLGVSFLLPTLAWMVPLYAALGHERFLFDVLLVGADYQTLYYTAHPAPEPYAVATVGAVLVVALAGRAVARGRLHPAVPGAVLGLGVLAAAVAAATTGLAPEGVGAAISSQLENASYWLAVTANFGGVFWLFHSRAVASAGSERRARQMMALTPLALVMYLQMFPRSDFTHQITAAPFTMTVAAALLVSVASWWTRAGAASRKRQTLVVRAAVLVVAAAVLLVELVTDLRGPIAMHADPAPEVPMPEAVDVHVEAKAGDELDALARTATFLRAHTEEGEPLWSFPATSGVLFAAGRPNPTPHDYWFPGRPDHREERRVLATLRASPPRYIVTLNSGWTFFEDSPEYFADTRRFVVEGYRLAARFGRFDVLARKDVAAQAVGSEVGGAVASEPAAPGADAAVAEALSPAAREAIEPDLQARRQAARRWMAALTPQEAAHASLPEDPRDAVRLLRALRDGGDMRAAGWAIIGFASANPRIRGEAVDAMEKMAASLRAHRLRLANDFDAAAYRPFVAPYAQNARELARFERLRGFANGVLELAGEAPEAAPRASGD